MKKIILVIMVAALASCKGNTTSEVPNSDTTVSEPKETHKLQNDQSKFGKWTSHVEHNSTKKIDSIKLIVSGSVELADFDAKVILIKAEQKKQIDPDELVLNLSKRPKKTMNKLVDVNYIEILQKENQYKKVRVMYRSDTVAILSSIPVLKNN